MPPRRPPMLAALQRSGTSARTQASSGRAVRLLAQCYGQAPALRSAQEMPHSLLPRNHVDGLAPAAMRLCSRGRRFFSQPVLGRDGHPRALLRPPTAPRLPAVLRVAEVRQLLPSATPCPNQVSCPTV
jgi:hypothetical protein